MRRLLLLAGLCLLVAASGDVSEPAAAAAPKLRSLGGGAWCWFGDPRGVHYRGASNRTYLGWIDREGDIKVSSYDHTTRWRTTAVVRWGLEIDDHDNPSLHVLPGGRVMVFYSRHGGDHMYYRVTRRPEDVTSWGPERTIPTNSPGERGYTYPNPVSLKAEPAPLWLFWRGGNYHPTFSTSADGGDSWSKARTLIEQPGQRPYVKYASNGRDQVHFAFTQSHPHRLNTNIYYARYHRGAVRRADGSRIRSLAKLPLSPPEADKIYDTSRRSWVHDIALDSEGRPVIVFASFASKTEHYYHYARWTGRRWIQRPMVAAGGSFADGGEEPYYSGGITLDHENPAVVHLSREVGGMHEIETWRTPDGGATWTQTAVTSGSSVENVRPVAPRGLRSFADDMSVVWMRGDYEHWLTYRTNITTRLLNGGNVPPSAEAIFSRRSGAAPLAVRFDGRRSRDPDGSIVNWAWRFGDGSTGTGPTPSHTYRSPGRYFAKLTVTDEDGDRDTFVSEVVAN